MSGKSSHAFLPNFGSPWSAIECSDNTTFFNIWNAEVTFSNIFNDPARTGYSPMSLPSFTKSSGSPSATILSTPFRPRCFLGLYPSVPSRLSSCFPIIVLASSVLMGSTNLTDQFQDEGVIGTTWLLCEDSDFSFSSSIRKSNGAGCSVDLQIRIGKCTRVLSHFSSLLLTYMNFIIFIILSSAEIQLYLTMRMLSQSNLR